MSEATEIASMGITTMIELMQARDEIKRLKEQLAKQEQGEPDKYVMDIECTKCGAKQSGTLTVHTPPQQRKPLTDEQIDEIYFKSDLEIDRQYNQLYAFVRAIEAAHGIKE
jgi:hypothetical protein